MQPNETLPMKLLLTVEEAAQVLSLGRSLLYELMAQKLIYSVKVGRNRRIPLKSLQAFVESLTAQQLGGQ